jgi:hypothetical protein
MLKGFLTRFPDFLSKKRRSLSCISRISRTANWGINKKKRRKKSIKKEKERGGCKIKRNQKKEKERKEIKKNSTLKVPSWLMLNSIEKKRSTAMCHGQLYQQRVMKAFDKKVKSRVLRK